MSRLRLVPSYKLHRASGQARVILDGRHVYLGPYGSPESREKYARLIAEWCAAQNCANAVVASQPNASRYPHLSINELLLQYLAFGERYYFRDGRPTGELHNMRDAMRSLRTLYGMSAAEEFGPRALKLVREHLIAVDDLSRGIVNARIDRIKRIFRWAASEELVPPSVYEGLRTVAGLRYGRSAARENEPVGPVADQWVEATIGFLPPQLADMVRLQRLTGMRSDNLTKMRPREIDRSGKIWIFEPIHHKTQHHKNRLRITLGPQAQAILQKYLNRQEHEYLFAPIEVLQWRAAERKRQISNRKTDLYPCEVKRLERQQRARQRSRRVRPPGLHFTTHSYRRAIVCAVLKANRAGIKVPAWFPHQLRHSKATEIRKQFGVEGAQLALGHAKANIIEVYAERDMEFAKRIARKTG